jgi:uncharacterized cupin superfamily protein
VDEARIENGVPTTAGWFVINAADAPWMRNEMRAVCKFGGQGPAHFDQLGIGLYWIEPGKPMTLYHHEAGQEDFLVLRGECILVIEGEERVLGAWDFVHCPPGTSHTIVAAGQAPALIFAVGARKERKSARYPFEPLAVRHGAGVPSEQTTGREHYATFGTHSRARHRLWSRARSAAESRLAIRRDRGAPSAPRGTGDRRTRRRDGCAGGACGPPCRAASPPRAAAASRTARGRAPETTARRR